MKTAACSTILLITLASAPLAWAAGGGPPTLCPAEKGVAGTFADCTKSQCDWDGTSRVMSCPCVVREDIDSMTTGKCQKGTDQILESRYPGVPGLGICSSATNVWGNCLGVECRRGRGGVPVCACIVTSSEENDAEQYVISGVGPDGAAAACSSDVYYSSATMQNVVVGSQLMDLPFPKILWVD